MKIGTKVVDSAQPGRAGVFQGYCGEDEQRLAVIWFDGELGCSRIPADRLGKAPTPRNVPQFDSSRLKAWPGTTSHQTPKESLRLARRAVRIEHRNALGVANAARTIGVLPAPGCSLHLVARGNYRLFDLVETIIRLTEPAAVDSLAVTTLGFDTDAARRLLALFDAGRVRRIAFACSTYFRRMSADDFAYLERGLAERGQAFAARRTHAKVQAYLLDDGRGYVVETSGNMRSCRANEQIALIHDADLARFHTDWISQIIQETEL